VNPDTFATLLCDWCLEVAPGQQVLISTTTLAAPLVRALHREILKRGGWPGIRLSPPGLAADFYRYAGEAQLDGVSPVEFAEIQAVDADLRITAPENTRELAGVEPARIARAARARQPIQETRLSRRWCGTIWPTAALAQDAGLSLDDYDAFLSGALFLDRPDPVAAWRALSERQAGLVERLSAVREVRIEAEGTDLTLRVDGRAWMNSDGRRNMPSGEVFTGPLERSAHGVIRFTVPTGPRGVTVEGVELRFHEGEVVEARAERGDSYLQAALQTDDGARYLGELGIGTNFGIDRPTGQILLDEKIGGTVHLALGRSYPETGGKNESALHWDLICDLRSSGRITVDGEALDLRPTE
jgi:aminopeptidase